MNYFQLADRFGEIVKQFGFENFAVGCVRDGDRPANMFLQNWPKGWIAEYIAGGYGTDDPIIPMAIKNIECFTWDVLRTQRTQGGGRVLRAAEAFGWRNGLVVPIHGPGDERGVVSLAARQMKMTDDDRPFVINLAVRAYRRGRVLHAAGGGPGLSVREREALGLVAEGFDDAGIGMIMGISRTTAHTHVERAKHRLGARSRAHAVGIATSYRLI